ncbi:reverse transcriptase domain-containing protein [Tanacetum coccineum]|uniref:Reverse transcriptase domain-containing protein n=1 Tax=Tanacetum coccineum TaxID=301880 RepID=A0ABQ5IFU4_9ASTR
MNAPKRWRFDPLPSLWYLAFRRHLEEIHATWDHLEKKQTRLQTNTKTLEDLCSQSLETASPTLHDALTTHLVTASHHFMMASARTDSHADQEYSNHDGVTIKTLVPHLVTPENKRIERYIYGLAPQTYGMVAVTEPAIIQKVVQKAVTLTDEAMRNRSLKKNTEKRGNSREPSRDRNVKDDNKRTRTGNAFAPTANPVRREYMDMAPKCTNFNLHHSPESPCRACFSCNRLRHLAKDCRVVPRMVNPVNARNPTTARGACFECGGTDHFKACPRLNQAQRPMGGCLNQVVAIDRGQGHGNNAN